MLIGSAAAAAAAAAVVLFVSAAAYACTNYVGVMKVAGNRSDTGTVTVTGDGMTQTVSADVARADAGASGWFQVWTGARSDNGAKLATGTYDVSWRNVAYGDHTTWVVPTADCMAWLPGSASLGTVSINSSGNISSGSGTYFLSYAASWATFDLPTAVANVGTQESGVCVSDAGSGDGNQAPLKLI